MKNRRDMLKASSAFMGAFAAFGLLGKANASAISDTTALRTAGVVPSPTIQVLRAIFTDAMQTGNMASTLPKFSTQLSKEQSSMLGKITPQDIMNLRIVKEKVTLDPAKVAGDAGGIIW
jgi:hypothetical protein